MGHGRRHNDAAAGDADDQAIGQHLRRQGDGEAFGQQAASVTAVAPAMGDVGHGTERQALPLLYRFKVAAAAAASAPQGCPLGAPVNAGALTLKVSLPLPP